MSVYEHSKSPSSFEFLIKCVVFLESGSEKHIHRKIFLRFYAVFGTIWMNNRLGVGACPSVFICRDLNSESTIPHDVTFAFASTECEYTFTFTF